MLFRSANSSGTWSVGDNLHAEHQMSVVSTIDADDPSTLVLVASAPTATRGSINWGLAEWQLAEDHEFTRNVQVITKPLTESGAQTGPSEFTLDKSPRPYYVRVRYLSDDQVDVFSEWSEGGERKLRSISICTEKGKPHCKQLL